MGVIFNPTRAKSFDENNWLQQNSSVLNKIPVKIASKDKFSVTFAKLKKNLKGNLSKSQHSFLNPLVNLHEAKLLNDNSSFRKLIADAKNIHKIIYNHPYIKRYKDIPVSDIVSTLTRHAELEHPLCIYKKRRIVETTDPNAGKYQWLLLNRSYECAIIGKGAAKKFIWGVEINSFDVKAIGVMDKNEKFKRQIAAIEKVRKAVNEQKAQGQKKPILDEFVLDIQSQGEYENKNADTKAAIVQEYMPSGDLFSYLYGDMPLSPESKWEVFYSLIEGTKHLHDIGIFLRDIKEENFLLNRDSIKVGDFDLACFKEDSEKEKTMLHGTLPFLSVAYLNRELKDALDLQDVWALGLIFYKMITVKNFVWLEAQTATEMIKLIKENCSSQEQIDKWFDKEVKEDSAGQLIYQMLTADHTKRPALESILRQITENKEDIKKSFLTLAIKLGYDKT